MTPRGLLEVSEAAPSGQGSEDREGWPLEREPGGEEGKGWEGIQAGRKSVPEAGEAAEADTSESGGLTRDRKGGCHSALHRGNKKQVVAQAPASHSGLRGTCVSLLEARGKRGGQGSRTRCSGCSGPELFHLAGSRPLSDVHCPHLCCHSDCSTTHTLRLFLNAFTMKSRS